MTEVLNCDNPECRHVEHVGTITESMTGMPCPQCGANLLSREDFDAWRAWFDTYKLLSGLLPADEGEEKVQIKLGLHGGKATIEIEKP